MSPFLSIITPIYDGTGTLKRYLDGIFSSEYRDFELLVVDDCSNDSPETILGGYRLKYRRLEKRGGSTSARNIGAGMASGQILVFIDQDVVIRPETLGEIVRVFEDHPEISGLICSYDDSPGAGNLVSQFKFLQHHYVHGREGEYVSSFWTGCGAIKRRVFEEVGGFDTAFFRNPEAIHDVELGYRLSRNRLRVYNAKHIQVKHLKILGFREWLMTDVFVRGVPWLKIMATYGDFGYRLNISPQSVLSVACAWAFAAAAGLSLADGSFIPLALLSLAILLASNLGLLGFFAKKRGILFSAASVPLLFTYYLACGISVIISPFVHTRI
jgi:glycosyltransferase involved in cell wall biosynthesis